MKNSEIKVPNIEDFEAAAARAWHSRMEGMSWQDQAILNSMVAGEVIAKPNVAYKIQRADSKIA